MADKKASVLNDGLLCFRSAIFDLDVTLIDSMQIWRSLAMHYFFTLGIDPPEEIQEKLKTMTMKESVAFFQREYGVTQTAEEVIDAVRALLEREYREYIPLKPHVRTFLRRLRDAGVKCCVVTANQRDLAVSALSRLGILDFFDFILTCEEAGSGKDTPQIFLMAAEMLGTDVAETIVFEDALYAVQTAKAAGFAVAGVYDLSAQADWETIKNTADRCICSFGEW